MVAKLFGCIFSLFACFSPAFAFDPADSTFTLDVDTLDTDLYTPTYNYEYIPDASYSEMEKRLARLHTEMPLHFNTRVKAFIDYFTVKDRAYTRMVMQRSKYYFPIFEESLAKYHMPDELKYLAVVESGLSARARSRAAAVGLWQFIYGTGKHYGLNIDGYVDERMDPHKATDAACRYIQSLYDMFGDWELALAAYNCGPGNVRKAIRRSGYKKTFWEIYNHLPRETRGYLPQFVALVYTFNYAEEHNFYLEDSEFVYPVSYDTIQVSDFVDLQTICDQLNICKDDLEMLNPAIKYGALPQSTRTYVLNIPADKYNYLMANRSVIMDSASRVGKTQVELLAKKIAGNTYGRDKVVYRVHSGDVLGSIAERYHVRVSDIRHWNNLHGNMIRVGQHLHIWVNGNAQASYASTSNTPKTTIINGTKYHIVQPGDTLWDIAKSYDNMTIEKLKKLNNLNGNNIKPGQKLLIG